jgi:uncharacterized protein (DUF58 family)
MLFKKKNKKKNFHIEILKAGYLYIILTILLGIAGVNTGNNLIYLIVSAMLSFMGLSGYLGKINLKKLDIELTFPEEIFAKTETPIVVKINNKKRFFSSFLLKISIKDKSILIPFVDNNSEVERHINILFPKRGKYKIEEIEICSVFPFNFFKRCVYKEINKEILVYPHPKKCKYLGFSNKHSKYKGDIYSQQKGSSGDIIGIRDYTTGDSLRLIHWKATAKTGELKTKELSDNQFEPILIDLEELNGNLEDKISCATFLILKSFKSLQPFGLKFKNNIFKPEFSLKQKVKLLKFLANLNNNSKK